MLPSCWVGGIAPSGCHNFITLLFKVYHWIRLDEIGQMHSDNSNDVRLSTVETILFPLQCPGPQAWSHWPVAFTSSDPTIYVNNGQYLKKKEKKKGK